MNRIAPLLLILIVSLFAVGCTMEEMIPQGSEQGSYPDISLRNGSYQLSQEGAQHMRVEADLIEITKEEETARFANARFNQLDEEGIPLFTGESGELFIETDTETIHLSGGYEVSVNSGEFLISGESLVYKSRERLLSSENASYTSLSNEKGDILSGTGFSGNLNTRLFEFIVLDKGYVSYDE